MSGPEWWSLVSPPPASAGTASTRYTIPPAKGGRPLDAYTQLAKDTASRHGLSPSLLAGVWDFESSGNPGAINKSSGATGLGQVMPRERGFPDRPTQQELLNPETNAEWSARILKSGLQRYGSEDKALAAYLGAIDARGNITGAVDANGTGGNQYIRTVRERQQRYADLAPAGDPTPTPAPAGPSASEGAPGWWSLVNEQAGGVSGGAPARGGGLAAPAGAAVGGQSPPPGPVAERQAIAASWALSQIGSKDWYDLCQRFIEQAYGTGGQFGSAGAAGKALVKSADLSQADAGDLLFFRPDKSNGFGGHAAIYLGNGEMVGATYGGVTRDRVDNPYWKNLFVGVADPPAQWQGRTGTAELVKGAQQFVGNAKAAVGSAAGAVGTAVGDAAANAPGWWSLVK